MNYDGTYFYLVKNFATDELVRQKSRCVIIGETKKSYRIRLLEYTNGHFPDECLWVRKKSICRSYFNNETERYATSIISLQPNNPVKPVSNGVNVDTIYCVSESRKVNREKEKDDYGKEC